jgi:hypothetical protein
MKLDLVTVRVGEEPRAADFQVCRELLTSVSPYFQGAFDGKFREADEGRVALTDITEQIFHAVGTRSIGMWRQRECPGYLCNVGGPSSRPSKIRGKSAR